MDAQQQSPEPDALGEIASGFPELNGAQILVVDDDELIGDLVTVTAGESGCRVSVAHTVREGRDMAKKKTFDVALIDAHLPDGSGMDVAKHFRAVSPATALVFISSFPDVAKAKRMNEMGVETLLTKPFTASQLLFTVYREFMRNHAQPADAADAGETLGLLGSSVFVCELRRNIMLFARGDIPVLIQGPTGTGKELIARAIHNFSRRSNRPMITVNCAAIPEHLMESEFFGYVKGAFTGAIADKDGLVKHAEGSTLFLDEVGELSPAMQAKLLRVIDVGEFTRVGDAVVRTVDIRILSATNRSLEDMVEKGVFRTDLIYRLKAGLITTEPIKNHTDDVPVLIEHFLRVNIERVGRKLRIDDGARALLLSFDWPGNVRQLKNAIDTLYLVCSGKPAVTVEDVRQVLAIDPLRPHTPHALFAQAKNDFEANYFRAMLYEHGGNIAAASRAAGIDRGNFSKKLKSLGIES